MAWFWFLICLGLLLVIAAISFEARRERLAHEQCHEATLDTLQALSNRSKARALRKAAEDYDSVKGRQGRARMLPGEAGREHSIPALWMLEEARKYHPEEADV